MPRYIAADWLLERAVQMGWSTPKWVNEFMINNAPTADVEEVRHGKWRTMVGNKMVDYDTETYRRYRVHYCTLCHKASAIKHNYCPNCGAKMDGKETEDE